MTDSDWTAGALGGRRRRVSEQEAAERTTHVKEAMLSTAERLVGTSGLTVSLGHLSFEDVIREAGVPRTAAYKAWSYKEDFFADLLRVLAGSNNPGHAAFDEGTVALAARLALDHLSGLKTEDDRRTMIVEVCRQGALQNFQAIYLSPVWQTYVALIATLSSLSSGDVQADVQAALNRTELEFVERMAKFYAVMVQFLGFRVRTEIPGGVTSLAVLGAAVVEGLALNAAIVPDVATERFEGDPFCTGQTREWNLPSIGYTSLVLGIIEPDPGFDEKAQRALIPVLEQLSRTAQ